MRFGYLRRGFSIMRRGVAVCAAGAALATMAVGLLAPAAGSAHAAVPTCSASKLKLTLVSFQGATGHRFWQFAFKNTGSKTCTLKGYPGAKLLKSGSYVLGTTVKHAPGTVATVTVPRGKLANFTFSYLDGGFCSVHVSATLLQFTAPGQGTKFNYNPVPANHGPISVCVGSAEITPLSAHAAG